VRAKGFEPPHLAILEPKSSASTSSATPAARRMRTGGARLRNREPPLYRRGEKGKSHGYIRGRRNGENPSGVSPVRKGTPPMNERKAAHPLNGDQDNPGRHPAEIQPGQGDRDEPGRSPAEIQPDEGDQDRPDSTPSETPPPDSLPDVPP